MMKVINRRKVKQNEAIMVKVTSHLIYKLYSFQYGINIYFLRNNIATQQWLILTFVIEKTKTKESPD